MSDSAQDLARQFLRRSLAARELDLNKVRAEARAVLEAHGVGGWALPFLRHTSAQVDKDGQRLTAKAAGRRKKKKERLEQQQLVRGAANEASRNGRAASVQGGAARLPTLRAPKIKSDFGDAKDVLGYDLSLRGYDLSRLDAGDIIHLEGGMSPTKEKEDDVPGATDTDEQQERRDKDLPAAAVSGGDKAHCDLSSTVVMDSPGFSDEEEGEEDDNDDDLDFVPEQPGERSPSKMLTPSPQENSDSHGNGDGDGTGTASSVPNEELEQLALEASLKLLNNDNDGSGTECEDLFDDAGPSLSSSPLHPPGETGEGTVSWLPPNTVGADEAEPEPNSNSNSDEGVDVVQPDSHVEVLVKEEQQEDEEEEVFERSGDQVAKSPGDIHGDGQPDVAYGDGDGDVNDDDYDCGFKRTSEKRHPRASDHGADWDPDPHCGQSLPVPTPGETELQTVKKGAWFTPRVQGRKSRNPRGTQLLDNDDDNAGRQGTSVGNGRSEQQQQNRNRKRQRQRQRTEGDEADGGNASSEVVELASTMTMKRRTKREKSAAAETSAAQVPNPGRRSGGEPPRKKPCKERDSVVSSRRALVGGEAANGESLPLVPSANNKDKDKDEGRDEDEDEEEEEEEEQEHEHEQKMETETGTTREELDPAVKNWNDAVVYGVRSGRRVHGGTRPKRRLLVDPERFLKQLIASGAVRVSRRSRKRRTREATAEAGL